SDLMLCLQVEYDMRYLHLTGVRFFFSSRRRHTRFSRDWSSDVCSSDLPGWGDRRPRDCTEFGPVAPQSAELPGAPVWRPGDEDVLSVNVWVRPRPDGGPLPVLFWIHGGAYTFGSSAEPGFDGAAL